MRHQVLIKSALAASILASLSITAHATDWLQFGGG